MDEIVKEKKRNIEANIAFSNNMNTFLMYEINYIFDILFRRASLKLYFD
jgi:hypothetical protein